LDRSRERHKELATEQQWLAGKILSAIANWSMGRPEEPLKPEDWGLPLVPAHVRRMNRKKVAADLRNYFDRKAVGAGRIRIKGGPE
jgi:hypothetical protein